jgi:hypothetical protein
MIEAVTLERTIVACFKVLTPQEEHPKSSSQSCANAGAKDKCLPGSVKAPQTASCRLYY